MIITVELSLYPLSENYETDILKCIEELKANTSISVFTNALSTQIKGEWNVVFSALNMSLSAVMDTEKTMSSVIKIINKDCAIEHGHLDL